MFVYDFLLPNLYSSFVTLCSDASSLPPKTSYRTGLPSIPLCPQSRVSMYDFPLSNVREVLCTDLAFDHSRSDVNAGRHQLRLWYILLGQHARRIRAGRHNPP